MITESIFYEKISDSENVQKLRAYSAEKKSGAINQDLSIALDAISEYEIGIMRLRRLYWAAVIAEKYIDTVTLSPSIRSVKL